MPTILEPLDAGDDGSAPPALAAALTAFSEGTAGARDVLALLSGTRVLVPLVAVRGEDSADMALPKLVGSDGRAAVLAFTAIAALTAWQADARPVQVTAERAALAAIQEEASAVLIDVAGPVRFAVEGDALRRLATGAGTPPLHEDPDVAAAVLAAAADIPGVDRVGLAPGTRSDLTVRLRAGAGHDGEQTARALGDRLSPSLTRYAPGGFEILVDQQDPPNDHPKLPH